MKALILCAGEGTRLGYFTEKIPKPMVLIGGKPILEYNINLCKAHGIKEIAINTSYFPKKIKEYFGDGSKFGVKIKYSYEKKLLGTAGALNNFKEFFKESFFVIYGDNITDLDLTKMKEAYKASKAFGIIYLYHEKMGDDKTTPGQVIIDKDFFVKEIIENPRESQKKDLEKIPNNLKFTNAGIYLLDSKIFSFIPSGESDFVKQIFPKILKEGLKIYGYRGDYYLREIGQIHRYIKAKEEIESGKIKLNYFKK